MELEKPAEQRASLITLNNEYMALGARLAELGGELTEETEAELEKLLGQLCEKTDGYGAVLRQLDNNAAFWKQQKDECLRAQQIYEAAAERLRERMKFVLAQTEGEALQGTFYRFFLARTAPKIDINLDLLDAKFKKTELVVSADRQAITAAVKEGKTPEGVTVTENKALRTGRPK